MNRELLQLAKSYKEDTIINGWYASIKYDGQRCFWDGGLSRGIHKSKVPFANLDKDSRYKDISSSICTGLWSRYGNIIHAPDYFLDGLPTGILLDGELWMGRGTFQLLRSTVSKLIPDDNWNKVAFYVFDNPTAFRMSTPGQINNPQFNKFISQSACLEFFKGLNKPIVTYQQTYDFLRSLPQHNQFVIIEQTLLKNKDHLYSLLEHEVNLNGEGLIIRNPAAYYEVKRTKNLLKVKPLDFEEATVIGHEPGKGKYEGMIGSLVVVNDLNIKFKVSGLTDLQRLQPNQFYNKRIRYKYVSLTRDGVPREARFDCVLD